MMVGFVKFEQHRHMLKAIVDLLIDVFFEGVKAFVYGFESRVYSVKAMIHRFNEIAKAVVIRFDQIAKAVFRRNLRIDQRNDGENDCDGNRNYLGIGQGFTLAGRLPALSLYRNGVLNAAN